jgi:hypothetical protein
MRWSIHLAGLSVVGLLLFCLGGTQARPAAGKRQYYEKTWHYNKKANYHYKEYKYKPKKNSEAYKTQYVVYKPAKPNWVYWYNPEKKTYWARCPTKNHPKYGQDIKKGKDYWSIIPPEKRKGNLDEINNKDYGKVTENSPPVPESNDDVHIECPPTDLPKG